MRYLYYLTHPFQGAMCVFRIVRHFIKSRLLGRFSCFLAEKQSRSIVRGTREKCWCGGGLLPFKWQQNYGVCGKCGCYVNRRPPLAGEIGKIYSLDFFWEERQRLKRIPTIEKRAEYYRQDGRVDRWMGLIGDYCPSSCKVVEVGCAPGVLLAELSKRGYECTGVEVCGDTIEWMKGSFDIDVIEGIFPGIELPKCSLFLAFDVIEHSLDPLAFMRGIADVLLPGGIAVVQTCVDPGNESPPFGLSFRNAFDDLEHLFVFKDGSIRELAGLSGLEIISPDDPRKGMDTVYVLKKG